MESPQKLVCFFPKCLYLKPNYTFKNMFFSAKNKFGCKVVLLIDFQLGISMFNFGRFGVKYVGTTPSMGSNLTIIITIG